MQILGSMLPRRLQEEVKRIFVYRYTGNHIPRWADKSIPPLFKSDKEWLENTWFEVTKKGELSRRTTHCTSHVPSTKG